MAHSDIRPSFSAGELSPSLWGRLDFAKARVGASVARNGFVSYRGGWSSRAGTAFAGACKQPASASSIPPRIIKFQFNIYQAYLLEFGDGYMRVATNGAYVTETPKAIAGATQANPCVLNIPTHGFAAGDWFAVTGVAGMIQLNGRTFVVDTVVDANHVIIADTFGDRINSLAFGAYTSGGTAARIYTVAAPYAAVDLPYLKVEQSADVMSLCCVNQATGTEYAPVDLKRLAANNWQFENLTFVSSIAAPAGVTATPTKTTGSDPTSYGYVVTAVDAVTGEESVASVAAFIDNSVDIALTAGAHIIRWSPVAGAASYNIYCTGAGYGTPIPATANFGYIGSSFGGRFVNSNILPDFTKQPPSHTNPFARGAILQVTMTSAGSGFNERTVGTTISTSTGTSALLIPIVNAAGGIDGVVILDGGYDYRNGDTVAFTNGSSPAAGTIVAGPLTGTYPGVVSYFQQRRFYAGSLNNPDTYWASQTGAYTNFDTSSPPIDSDAITGTPWGEQVNGIQWLRSMPGGLIAATGQDAWQLSGTAGAGSLITPSQQSAAPQESNGFSPTVPIIKINYELLYVSSFATAVYDLSYNFFTNIYAGVDISVLSNHLFQNFTITHWAYAKQPYKVVWASRSDGKFLSLTFLKEQEIAAWCRHDTNGFVACIETVAEPPVDAVYMIVKRYIVGKRAWAYYLERMDNRAWDGPEDPWCIDCGLALPQPAPAATLTASSAVGPGTITGGYLAAGGQGYTNPIAVINDPSGQGSGAAISFTVTNGVITAFQIDAPGENYPLSTTVDIQDVNGFGASLILNISQDVVFTTDQPVFGSTAAGDVLRTGGGIAIVTSVASPQQITASIKSPILNLMPNDPNGLPVPAAPGAWTITTPVSTISNLGHLEGMQVAVLADGNVVAGGDEPLLTVKNGTITLPQPASSVKVGLPFIAQVQDMHEEPAGAPTIQGKRKKITAATVRLEKSRGVEVGANQPVASTLAAQQEIPWQNMSEVPDIAADGVPSAALPLFTGDKRVEIAGGWQNWNGFEPAPGFVCAQQRNPLPLNVLAFVKEYEVGDSDG